MMFWTFFFIGALLGSALVLIVFCINGKPDTTTYDRRKVDREVNRLIRDVNYSVEQKLRGTK